MTERAMAGPAGRLDSVQMLRAVAALMVVTGHVIGTARIHPELFEPFWTPAFYGGAGVDIFFLISGFIMVVASGRMFGHARGAADFAIRRLVRIVPLYWAVTAVALALLIRKGTAPDGAAIAASFAFVPNDTTGRGDGFAFPIVDLGWTLNYEMMFYLVFALWLPFGRNRCVIGTALTIGALIVLGMVMQPAAVPLRFWTQPISAEFVAGMAVAMLYLRGRLDMPVVMRLVMVAIAIAWYLADPAGLGGQNPTTNGFARVIGWGVPSALLLAAAVAGPVPLGARLARGPVLLGDASYALYLLHPFVIAAVLRLAPRLSVDEGWEFSVLTITAACVVAIVAHKLGERPVTEWLTRRLRHIGAPISAAPVRPDPAAGGGDPR